MTKYDASSVGVVDALSLMRSNKPMFLGREEVIPSQLATAIADDALTLGVTSVGLHHHGDWWLISSADDWLQIGNELGIEETFTRIVGLQGGPVNSMRREIYLTAYASAAFTRKGDSACWISGTAAEHEAALAPSLASIPPSHRVIGFRI